MWKAGRLTKKHMGANKIQITNSGSGKVIEAKMQVQEVFAERSASNNPL